MNPPPYSLWPPKVDLVPSVPRIVTIGSFDGVHRGHEQLLRSVVERGVTRGAPTWAVTFEPLPPVVLRPEAFSGRICTADEKRHQLMSSGIEGIITFEFTLAFAQQSPETFMKSLVAETSLEELWVGETFALGRQRVGDVARLTEIGNESGFRVVAVPRLAIESRIVSSSGIRQAITDGDAATVELLLGRPFRLSGQVVHGAHLGRTIGFPTANVVPPRELVALADGIYASLARLPNRPDPRLAMTYVGTRPTINTGERIIETHLFDFEADLYGTQLTVDIVGRLRSDQRFSTVAALVDQLRQDERDARIFLGRYELTTTSRN